MFPPRLVEILSKGHYDDFRIQSNEEFARTADPLIFHLNLVADQIMFTSSRLTGSSTLYSEHPVPGRSLSLYSGLLSEKRAALAEKWLCQWLVMPYDRRDPSALATRLFVLTNLYIRTEYDTTLYELKALESSLIDPAYYAYCYAKAIFRSESETAISILESLVEETPYNFAFFDLMNVYRCNKHTTYAFERSNEALENHPDNSIYAVSLYFAAKDLNKLHLVMPRLEAGFEKAALLTIQYGAVPQCSNRANSKSLSKGLPPSKANTKPTIAPAAKRFSKPPASTKTTPATSPRPTPRGPNSQNCRIGTLIPPMTFPTPGTKQELEQGTVFTPKFDQDGLIPAVAQDHATGQILMLAYMNAEALSKTLEIGQAVYYSRSRQGLWHKGATSGQYQVVHQILVDCDQDALILRVEQLGGGACHTGATSCFYRSVPVGESPDRGIMPLETQ